MAENLITKQELQDYAPDLDLSGLSDATISGMINRASARVQEFAQVDGFFKATVTDERSRAVVAANGDLIYSFRRRPVADGDLTTLTLVGVNSSQNLSLTEGGSRIYYIPEPGNVVVYPSNYLIAHGTGLIAFRSADLFLEVDYVGGYATDIANIPPTLKEATTLYMRHMLQRKNNPGGMKSFSQGSVSVTYAEGGTSKLVEEAEDLLTRGGFVRRVP